MEAPQGTRRVVVLILLGAAVAILASRVAPLEAFLDAARRGAPAWLALSLALTTLWLATQVEQFRAAMRLAGVHRDYRSLTPVVLGNQFVLLALPSGNLSTFALFALDARRRGSTTSGVTLGLTLFAIVEFLVVSVWAGVALLIERGSPVFLLLAIPVALFGGLATAGAVGLGVGMQSTRRLQIWSDAVATHLDRLSRRLLGRELPIANGLRDFVRRIVDDLATLRSRPWRAWSRIVSVAAAKTATLALLLASVGLAFGSAMTWQQAWVGACVALVFTVISPIPQGVGVVEAALAWTLTTFGRPAEESVLVSLTFRGLSLWLPVVCGFLALQLTGLRLVVTRPRRRSFRIRSRR